MPRAVTWLGHGHGIIPGSLYHLAYCLAVPPGEKGGHSGARSAWILGIEPTCCRREDGDVPLHPVRSLLPPLLRRRRGRLARLSATDASGTCGTRHGRLAACKHYFWSAGRAGGDRGSGAVSRRPGLPRL